jgi:hypothetical protein
MIVRTGITSFYWRKKLPEFPFDDFKRIVYAIAQDWRTPAANPKLKPEEAQCQPMKRNPVGPLIKISSMVQSS